MKNQQHALFSILLFIVIGALYLLLAIYNPIAYMWVTYEDLIGEWAQFYLFLFALIFSLRHVLLGKRYRNFFIFLAIACLYVILEEISWGQRLFGWESSEFFREYNLQGETNIHNMLTGPYTTIQKQFLEYGLALGLSGFGLIYPLALKYQWHPAIELDKLGVPAPPFYLAPFFVSAAYLELGPLSFNEAEIAEIFVGLGLSLMALHYLHVRQSQIEIEKGSVLSNAWTNKRSTVLSYRMAQLVFMVFLLSIATTFSIYATDSGKKRVDNRISNGIEKFSGRYKNYENWGMVIFLNNRLLKKSPSNRWVLRNLGLAYRKIDNKKLSDVYLNKAIDKDLNALEKEPWRASTNRSLVRTYRIMGDSVNSKKYLAKAHQIGLERLNKKPNSASALYSLGKTYLLMNEKGKARPLFARAYELKPTSKKYRKEYYRSIR